MGDINTDPFTMAGFDSSATAWNEHVGEGRGFDYLSGDSAEDEASYQGFAHIDHIVSDDGLRRAEAGCMIGEIWETVYWDHRPVSCHVQRAAP